MSSLPEKEERNREDVREQIRMELESRRGAFHQLLDEISEDDLTKPSLNPA